MNALIRGLPAGAGYSITLTGTTTDGSATCSGSATFDVVAHQTAVASLSLSCHTATTSVQVNGVINVCPFADGISANPAQVAVGSTIALSASAHDSDHGPSALAYSWTASSGTLSDAMSASPTFTRIAPGTVTLSVTVSDGDRTPDCTDSATVTCSVTAAQEQTIINTNCTVVTRAPTHHAAYRSSTSKPRSAYPQPAAHKRTRGGVGLDRQLVS